MGSLYIVSGAARRQFGNLPLPIGSPGSRGREKYPEMGELRKPVLLNAGPRQGARLWSVVAVHPRLRQLLKPLEFARKAASAGAVSWCVAGGWIGPGSQGSSSHPKGSRSAFNLGGGGAACISPAPAAHAGCSRGPAAMLAWGTECPHRPTASPLASQLLFVDFCFHLQRVNS